MNLAFDYPDPITTSYHSTSQLPTAGWKAPAHGTKPDLPPETGYIRVYTRTVPAASRQDKKGKDGR